MHPRTILAAAAITFMVLAGVGQPAASQPSTNPFGGSSKTSKKPAAPTPAPKRAGMGEQPQPSQTQQPQGGPGAAQGGAPEPAALSPAASAACQTVTACFGELAAKHYYRAVDEYFDPDGFSRRVLGANFDRLDGAQQTYFAELTNVMFKSLVSHAAFTAALAAGQNPKLSASELNGDVVVSFLSTTPEDGQRRHTFVLHQTSAGWKIVDVNTVAQRTAELFKQQAFEPETATVCMEAMIGGVIQSKFARLDDSAVRRNEDRVREAQAGNLRAQLKSLMNQLELYKARTGQYPDLAAHGWDDLIKGGYIKRAPVNPVNQSSKICIGLRGKAGYGWSWNPSTGDLGATYLDEQTMALTPDAP